jgi:hypothetical protein
MSDIVAVRVARRLVRLYPRAWRTRYAAEVLDLLEARPPTWGDAGNLVLHGLYTHLHPDLTLTGGESPVERLAVLMRALRSSEIAIFWAFAAAMIAWLQFGGLVDGGPYMPLTDSAGGWPFFGMSPANGISAALAVQSAAVDLAFLAVLAGGVPLAVAAWRRVPSLRRYFLVPVAAFIGAVLPVPIAVLLRGPVATINLTFTTPITDAYFVWFVGLAAVSALALGRVIAAGALDEGLLRFAFVPSLVATVALLLLLGATVAWGIAAHQEYPQLFDHAAVDLGHATVTSWMFDVLVLAGAACVAVLATIRGAIAGAAAAPR